MWDDLLQTSILVSIAAATLRIATPVLFAALGEMITERTGVYNMGLEGIMLMGAFTAYLGAYQSGSAWFGAIAAIMTGAMFGLLFAFLVVSLKIEQIVTGLALSLLGAGLSVFWLRSAFQGGSPPPIGVLENAPIPGLSHIPLIGPVLFDQKVLTYVALLTVPALGWVLFNTRIGL